jgi:hypothetical protein
MVSDLVQCYFYLGYSIDRDEENISVRRKLAEVTFGLFSQLATALCDGSSWILSARWDFVTGPCKVHI